LNTQKTAEEKLLLFKLSHASCSINESAPLSASLNEVPFVYEKGILGNLQHPTALHVAIERRSLDHVKLLVQKGADVQAKANGKFFQPKAKHGFYFGELPLSLAVSTNQPDIVSFLIEEGEADVADQDSHGNTVLHILVVMADNTAENTEMFAAMYDKILILHHKLKKQTEDHLEEIKNNQDLTPLKLAAKLGKIGLLKHMKFTEWVYGPVHSSLYDISSIDTDEQNSVLEIIIFGSKIPVRKMLQIEPLRSLLEDKWSTFASKLFLINFLLYLIYLIIFTTVAVYRKDGQVRRKHGVGNSLDGDDSELIVLLCLTSKSTDYFLPEEPSKLQGSIHRRIHRPPLVSTASRCFYASLLLVSALLYLTGRREYVGLLVLSLALAWMNVLYYSRGFKQLGMYFVMMQRMILGDLLHFLFVYGVFLFGFSAAIVALIDEPPLTQHNATNASLANGQSFAEDPFKAEELSYHDMRFTTLELFKFTIGMGDIQFTDHVQYKEVFYILLICYIVLTYILLLNMLIALMGNTVERISTQSENIWNLQVRSSDSLESRLQHTKPNVYRIRLNPSEKEKSNSNRYTTQQEWLLKSPVPSVLVQSLSHSEPSLLCWNHSDFHSIAQNQEDKSLPIFFCSLFLCVFFFLNSNLFCSILRVEKSGVTCQAFGRKQQ
uniref:Transient receptor potential cation channel subfamily V member 1-like n=1 Tax=Stegastes partitus TaxID=144197 RepID=A0A3B4ZVX9_9TELE